MRPSRPLAALALAGAFAATTACTTGRYGNPYASQPYAPPVAVGADIGAASAYLSDDVVGGRDDRSARVARAGVDSLGRGEVRAYIDRQEADLRRQTVGTGVEVIRNGNDLIVRMPAAITFPVGSAAIEPQFQATLREVAQTLKSYSQTYVDVLGHTDASGGTAANQSLSVSRAQAVSNYLKSRGVIAARIGVRGYGETAPIASNDSEEGRATNRRVEIKVVPVSV